MVKSFSSGSSNGPPCTTKTRARSNVKAVLSALQQRSESQPTRGLHHWLPICHPLTLHHSHFQQAPPTLSHIHFQQASQTAFLRTSKNGYALTELKTAA